MPLPDYPSGGSGLIHDVYSECAVDLVDQDFEVKTCHVSHEHEGFLQRRARIHRPSTDSNSKGDSNTS